MNQVEDRLTSLLTRTADAIEVEPDVDRVLDPAPVILLSGPRSPRRRRAVVLLAGAAAAASVAVAAYWTGLAGQSDVEVEAPAGPTGGTEATGTVPRFVVTQEGWQIDYVDEASDDFGEMSFADGAGNSLQLARYPAEEYATRVEDHERGTPESWTVTIAGQEATVFDYGTSFLASWRHGDYGFELSGGTFATRETFEAVVATVEEVDESEWLAALPDDGVHPDERPAEVESVLAEIPVPPGLDTEDILSTMGRPFGTRDELQAAAVDAVVCGWINQWMEADDAGDSAARGQAVDAMASSRGWPPLAAKAGGPWTTYIWDVADAMADDVPAITEPGLDQGTGYLRHAQCPGAYPED